MLPSRSMTTLVVILVASCADATDPALTGPPNTLVFDQGAMTVRQGDAFRIGIQAYDANGDLLPPTALSWTTVPFGSGEMTEGGLFVGYHPGEIDVSMTWQGLADTLHLEIVPRNVPAGELVQVGRGPQNSSWNTDLWVQGGYAYMGSMTSGAGQGDELWVWNVMDPGSPRLEGTFQVDANIVNDVKVSPDGAVIAVTHEGSLDGRNGVTLLSLEDPAEPRLLTRYMTGLSPGVHNAWFEGRYLYLAVNDVGGLHILDVLNPHHPITIATFYAGSSFVHDVFVRDGLAFISHWDAGLVILDVGNGIAGGAPNRPVEVGRITIPGVKVHNAWYWPAKASVFIGDEVRGPGSVYVIDVSDLRDPVLVAEFRTPDTPARPHNLWIDESNEVLWLSWYRDGIYAMDASGTLRGRLDEQGRTILHARYGHSQTGCFDIVAEGTCAWAPQLHGGLLYVADVNSGLWIFQPDF